MKKITIVDDDPDLRNLLKVVLRSRQFVVDVFPTAEEFMNNYVPPSDLFVIDINLGGLSGLDVCKSLKQQATTKHVPVIIISAHPELEKLAREVCADATLTKPFSQANLLKLIQQLI